MKTLGLAQEPFVAGGPLSSSGHLGVKDGGREVGEGRRERGGRERGEGEMKRKDNTTQKEPPRRSVAGNERRIKKAHDREKEGATRRVGIVLTLISLRMTSIMLPITMRKSNTFQGSLKYPYTG